MQRKKILLASVLTIALLIGALAGYYLLVHQQATTENSGVVTKMGTIACLQKKDTSDAQTQECGIGLKQDDGKMYALQTNNTSMNLQKFTSGEHVEVSGQLVIEDSVYDIKGVLKVDSITKHSM
jgi:hypothetical protein